MLLEDIYVGPDAKKLVVANSADKKQRASGKDFISTAKPRLPHPTDSQRSGNITVYSGYLYRSSKITTDILSSLKGKGPYEVNDSALNHFIAETAAWMGPVLKRQVNPTIIVHPKSTSDLTRKFVEQLAKHIPDAEIVPDAFVKEIIQLTGDETKDRATVGSLIDIEHPKFETLSKETVDSLEKRILALLKQEGSGIVPIKKIYKPLTQFIKGFMKAEPQLKDTLGQARVLVIDDIMSSGGTLKEMVSIVSKRGAETVAGATIFRGTSTPTE